MSTIDRRRTTPHADASPGAPWGCGGAGPSATSLRLAGGRTPTSANLLASDAHGARNATALTRDADSYRPRGSVGCQGSFPSHAPA